MVEVINHVVKAEKELTQRLGRQPTINEITTELGGQAKGFTARKVVTIKKINIAPITLDKTVGNDDESQILDFVMLQLLMNLRKVICCVNELHKCLNQHYYLMNK